MRAGLFRHETLTFKGLVSCFMILIRLYECTTGTAAALITLPACREKDNKQLLKVTNQDVISSDQLPGAISVLSNSVYSCRFSLRKHCCTRKFAPKLLSLGNSISPLPYRWEAAAACPPLSVDPDMSAGVWTLQSHQHL